MEKIIDLHIHTNMSDGELSPKQIIDRAYSNGVSIIAIADHDTVDAYTGELYDYAEAKGIKLINAVEISSRTDKIGIHVLGYNFDINNKELRDKLLSLRNSRHDYLHNVAQRLNELGFILNVNELDKVEAVTKAHIALDIINNKENNSLLYETFGYIPNKGEFIETIMNEGCPAYVKKNTISPKEAADLIKKAGGKAVLAHPVAYKYEDGLSDEDISLLTKEMNADGIEANYIYLDRNNNKIDESNKWNEYAKQKNLFATIGSDFHNFDGVHSDIGLVNEDIKLSDIDITNIISNLIN